MNNERYVTPPPPRSTPLWVSTLHYSVGGLHRGQVGDNSDIIIPAGAFNVNVDGALDLAVQTCHHTRGVCHIGEAALAVVPGKWEITSRLSSEEKDKSILAAHIKKTQQQLKKPRCDIN